MLVMVTGGTDSQRTHWGRRPFTLPFDHTVSVIDELSPHLAAPLFHKDTVNTADTVKVTWSVG